MDAVNMRGLLIGVRSGNRHERTFHRRSAGTCRSSGRPRAPWAEGPQSVVRESTSHASHATAHSLRWTFAWRNLGRRDGPRRGPFQRGTRSRGADAVAIYNCGQLLLEEYYAIGKIARGGIGISNIDANTRLCTATSASR